MIFRQFLVLLAFLMCGNVSAKVWHVCIECPDSDAKSIETALHRAKPKDTILVYWEINFPIFMENLVIDKPVRIISNTAAGDISDFSYYPVITSPGSSDKPVIHVKVPGVEIIGLTIKHGQAAPEELPDERQVGKRVGIQLDAPALIRHCCIMNCGTGILAEYKNGKKGSLIELCRLGMPPDQAIKNVALSSGNFFGLVLLGNAPDISTVTFPDRIHKCTIMKNTYYGVIYSQEFQPLMSDNTIELNGKRPFRIALDTRDPKGNLSWVDANLSQ